MNIVFICGTLEPGKDGVGDYTRKLASELIAQGNYASIIALYDVFISHILEENQDSEGVLVPCLRIPADMNNGTCDLRINSYIASRSPEWLSLQLVLYAYHKKGLPFNLDKRLSAVAKGKKWHIMFHEIWIGWAKHDTLRHMIIGRIQKRIIQNLANTLKPSIIHTQTPIYKKKLQRLGFSVELLPLFSNIPLLNDEKVMTENNKIEMVLFGAVHPYAPVEHFVKELSQNFGNQLKTITLTLIGRNGKAAQRWIKLFKAENISVEVLGEQSPEQISKVLNSATIGITSTPIYLIEKSGTIAAMRQYALPIICVSRPWMPKQAKLTEIPDDIFFYQVGNFRDFNILKPNSANYRSAFDIAKKFAADLSL